MINFPGYFTTCQVDCWVPRVSIVTHIKYAIQLTFLDTFQVEVPGCWLLLIRIVVIRSTHFPGYLSIWGTRVSIVTCIRPLTFMGTCQIEVPRCQLLHLSGQSLSWVFEWESQLLLTLSCPSVLPSSFPFPLSWVSVVTTLPLQWLLYHFTDNVTSSLVTLTPHWKLYHFLDHYTTSVTWVNTSQTTLPLHLQCYHFTYSVTTSLTTLPT